MRNKDFKKTVIGLNFILILLFFSYFIGHGSPESFILWTSGILWLVTPMFNLFYILKIKVK